MVRFQNRLVSMIGPKVAPKPAQAKATRVKITLFSSSAITTPTAEITSSMMRLTHSTFLSLASFFSTPW